MHKISTSLDIVYQTCLNTFGVKQLRKAENSVKRKNSASRRKNVRKQAKRATKEEGAAQALARFEGGETLSIEQSRICTEKPKS